MAKIELNSVTSGYNLSAINDNFQKIETEFKDKVVYRDENSPLEEDLDANGQRILNLPDATTPNEPATYRQVQGLLTSVADGVIASMVEEQVATASQTVFTLSSIQYAPGSNNLRVYVNGLLQDRGDAYIETSSTVVTFTEGLEAGWVVHFISNESVTNTTIDATIRQELSGTGVGQGADMVANRSGGTLQDVADTVGKVATSMSTVDIATAIASARAAGGGDVVSLPSSGSLSGSAPVEIVGDFGDGLLFDGRRATITGTGTAANQDGMLVGNKVGSVASQYFNKYKVANVSFVGPGITGLSAGVHQQAAADIQLENLHIRNWPIGILLEGGLTSKYTGITTRANGIGVQAKVYDDGAGGINEFSPNANSFYDLRCYENEIAVKYDNNPSGCANWFGCNFEGNNYLTGTNTDGKKVIELTNAGHQNFIGCHLESNEGQYAIYYEGFDNSKSLFVAGSEMIDAVGTNLHMQRGRLTAIASRITNTSSTEDIFLNTGARATLIDTEGVVTGDVSSMVAIRDGRIGFGIQPVVASPLIDMQPTAITAGLNVAANFRNDTVQLRFQNTAGTRVGYVQTSATGNHTLWNDNASGGWAFGAGNATRMYIGRIGANSIEPGSATTDCGTPTLPWNGVYSKTVRTMSSTVAALPTAASAGAGARAFVTDATLRTFDSVVVGGGANAMPVWSDGTNWRIG